MQFPAALSRKSRSTKLSERLSGIVLVKNTRLLNRHPVPWEEGSCPKIPPEIVQHPSRDFGQFLQRSVSTPNKQWKAVSTARTSFWKVLNAGSELSISLMDILKRGKIPIILETEQGVILSIGQIWMKFREDWCLERALKVFLGRERHVRAVDLWTREGELHLELKTSLSLWKVLFSGTISISQLINLSVTNFPLV
jgi:hypothetical protein